MSSDQIQISPSGPVNAAIRPPSSKSITNRALICAALADGTSTLLHPLESDDTHYMIDSLHRLGIRIEQETDRVHVHGCGGTIPASTAELFIGNSGTSVRFLTALLCLGSGSYSIDGVPRMRERPIGDLLMALSQLGPKFECPTDCPPVHVQASGLNSGSVSIRGDISSQYLSGLLMSAPYAAGPVKVDVDGELVSRPYVEMTTRIMAEFGVDVSSSDAEFIVPRAGYKPIEYSIEPDASAASYYWAAAAILGGTATVKELSKESLQGDVGFCDLLVRMGCTRTDTTGGITIERNGPLTGIDCDMADVSDTAQTLSVVALFADGPTTIRGIAHNRHKETDRIGNLAIELRKFGAAVEEFEDGFKVIPPSELQAATIDTYDDHRMAMSLSLPGLKIPGTIIRDPGCTAKTYPHFFEDLAKFVAGS